MASNLVSISFLLITDNPSLHHHIRQFYQLCNQLSYVSESLRSSSEATRPSDLRALSNISENLTMNFSRAGFSIDERLIRLKLMLMKLFASTEKEENRQGQYQVVEYQLRACVRAYACARARVRV